MSTVQICLRDIFGMAVGCDVIFKPLDTPFVDGAALTVSGSQSVRLDAAGLGSVTLQPGRYSVRFLGITSNTDTLSITVPNDAASYNLTALIGSGTAIVTLPPDYLKSAANLADLKDAAAAFSAIKQPASTDASGVVQIATQAEVDAESDPAKCVTPSTLAQAAQWATKANTIHTHPEVNFLNGNGAPADALGVEGNSYVDVTTGDFYHRGSDGWAFVLNIKGPQGGQGIQGAQGIAGVPGTNGTSGASAADLARIATLQFWRTPANFPAGTNPKAICFDGVNVWIANNGSCNVTKLVAVTGALVGTYATGAGVALCFDGTNVWVLNSNATVTVLVAATGALVNTYPVASGAAYICCDGSNIWTAGGTILAKYLASTGAQVGGNIVLPNATAYGICFDGINIWVAEGSSGVTKVTASTGAIVGTYGGNLGTRGICFDGYTIWAVGSGGGLTQFLPSTGAVLSSPRFLSSGAASLPLVFDGSSLWTIAAGSTIYRLNIGNGTVTAFPTTALVGTFNSNGMAFDGSRIWYPNGTTVTRI